MNDCCHSEPMSDEDAHEDIIDGLINCNIDNLDTDEDGQVVVYTGIYRWKNGSYHTKQEFIVEPV